VKHGEFVDPKIFLDKDLFVWQKPPIEKLYDSLVKTEIIKFQLEHLLDMPGFDFFIWVVIYELAAEKRNRLIWRVGGLITNSAPRLHEFPRFSFSGRLDYANPGATSQLKITK
jgi:hypothetical protein